MPTSDPLPPSCSDCGMTVGHTEICEGFVRNDPGRRPPAPLPMSEEAIRQLLDGATTPGPWSVIDRGYGHVGVTSERFPTIPTVVYAHSGQDGYGNGSTKGDAALLAAAPDLAATALALHADLAARGNEGVAGEYHREVVARLTVQRDQARAENERLVSGDYCEHGLDCPGTGPECARMGTVEEARQRAWDAGVLLSNADHAEQATTITTLEGIVKRQREGYRHGTSGRYDDPDSHYWYHPDIAGNWVPMTPAERIILTGEAEQ